MIMPAMMNARENTMSTNSFIQKIGALLCMSLTARKRHWSGSEIFPRRIPGQAGDDKLIDGYVTLHPGVRGNGRRRGGRACQRNNPARNRCRIPAVPAIPILSRSFRRSGLGRNDPSVFSILTVVQARHPALLRAEANRHRVSGI